MRLDGSHTFFRLMVSGASLALLCLVLSACGPTTTSGAAQVATPTAQKTPPRSHLPPVGGGGGGGDITPTPTPTKLSALPTTLGTWTACTAGSPLCSYAGDLYASVKLSNGGTNTILSWSIGATNVPAGSNAILFAPGSGILGPGQTTTLVVIIADHTLIQAIVNGDQLKLWFDVVGPINSVQITII